MMGLRSRCEKCKYNHVCDLDCGDPQGYSFTPMESPDNPPPLEREEESEVRDKWPHPVRLDGGKPKGGAI